MNKVTINANNLDDFSVDSWTINRDPAIGNEEPEQVSVEHDGKAYTLKFWTNSDGEYEVTLDVWELTPAGELNVPIKSVKIDGFKDE